MFDALAAPDTDPRPLARIPAMSPAAIVAGVRALAAHQMAEHQLTALRTRRAELFETVRTLSGNLNGPDHAMHAAAARLAPLHREIAELEAKIVAARQRVAPLRRAHAQRIADALAPIRHATAQRVLDALEDLRAATQILDECDLESSQAARQPVDRLPWRALASGDIEMRARGVLASNR